MKTRSYTVHLSNKASDDGLVLIEEGFSWPGFFIFVPWALFHRMWVEAGVFIFLQALIVIVFDVTALTSTGQGVVMLATALAFGFLADDLRRNSLVRQGYQINEVILEQNIDKATQRFLTSRPDISTRMAARL